MNIKKVIIYTILFVVFIFPATTIADQVPDKNTIEINDHKSKYSIGKNVRYLEDRTKALSFEDICKKNVNTDFLQNKTDIPNFGFTDSVYWFTWTINYKGPFSREWLLEMGYPHLDDIKLYIIDQDGKIDIREAGDLFKFSQREMAYRHFIFHVLFKPDTPKRFYLKIRSESSIQLPLMIWEPVQFIENVTVVEIFMGFIVGSVAILFFYNLFLFLTIRNTLFLFFLVAISTYILSQLTINGHAFQYLWHESPFLANKTLPIWIIVSGTCLAIFSKKHINPKAFSKFTNTLISIVIFCGLLILPLTLTISYSYNIQIVLLFTLFAISIMFYSGIVAVIKKQPASRFYLAAWLAYCVGTGLYALKAMGYFHSNFFIEHSFQIGSVVFITMTSIAIVDKINYQRNQSDQKLEDALASNSLLLKEQEDIHAINEKTAQNIDNESEIMAIATEGLSENFSELMRQTKNGIQISEEMTENTKNISTSIDQMGHFIEKVLSAAKELSSTIDHVFEAIDQLFKSMKNIEDISCKGSSISHNAGVLSQKTTKTMSDLEQAAMEIGNVSEMIKRISDKTNLLSLNAAIESANAGEAGKGFAVVANSIQKFADQSAMAAEDISHIIGDVQTRSQEANAVISNIAHIVNDMNASSDHILESVEEQAKTVQHIAKWAPESRKDSTDISQLIQDLAESANDILANVHEITNDIDTVSVSISDISLAIKESQAGVIQINKASGVLSKTSKELRV